ncbi:hypothetical protein J6590_069272 [Homalodisca vitripennis]|nr:hypothetical protein J6590_069272 [Homalodisca vitripennis]
MGKCIMRGQGQMFALHPLAERSDSAPRFETGQHLFYKSLRRNTPDSCLQLPSLRFPPSTFEEGVQGIVRIRIPVLAFRRDNYIDRMSERGRALP